MAAQSAHRSALRKIGMKNGRRMHRRKRGILPEESIGKFFLSQFFLCFWLDPKAPKDQAPRKVAEAVRSGMPRACHVRTQPNNHRCAKRTTSSALHRRQEQIERRFERPDRVCANGVDLACPLRENRRPIPTEVPCGHFWRRLLVTKDGKDFLAGNSRKVGMFPTLSQPDSVKKYAFSAAAEERQPAAARCGGLHRPACGLRHILRRPRVDKRR